MAIETVTRVKIVMPQSEYTALLKAAGDTLRTPDAEARYIVRCDLERRGLLSAEGAAEFIEVQHATD